MNAVPWPSSSFFSGMPLFRCGFRPFFLLGPIFSMAVLGHFVLLMTGKAQFLPSQWDMLLWHKHEMLFGYAGAIIAGFLLTAVPNWTGHPTLRGGALAAVTVLWIAGRLAVFYSAHLPLMLVAAVDASFFLACIAGILPALVKSGNRRNYFFMVLLALLAGANLLAHIGREDIGILLALNVITMMMVVIGGRVIPFFTERGLNIPVTRRPWLEPAVALSTIVALTLEVVALHPVATGAAFLIAAMLNAWRMAGWRTTATLRTPLLWVLHAGYAWLVVGMAMKAAHELADAVPHVAVAHAFTTGAIGTLTLGMMARVSLGHTGRPLAVGNGMTCAFLLMTAAAVLRVLCVWLLPGQIMLWMQLAAVCWFAAFLLFVWIYAPILTRSRVDGKYG